MADLPDDDIAWWRRTIAYVWYIWGMSLCYWGIRTMDRSFYQAGVNAFSRAINLWPTFSGSYYRRGLIRGRELGEHEQGIRDLTRAIEYNPIWSEPYLQRGLLQRFHGTPQAALEDLHRYLLLSHSSAAWRAEVERQIVLLQKEIDP